VVKRRAVFLDRDGVVNRALIRDGKPYPPANLAELELLPGVGEALGRLKASGFFLVVVSNQPDVARGAAKRDVVDSINQHLMESLPIDEMRVCYHDDQDFCGCRKPLPGLLVGAASAHDLDLGASYMVGDRWKDVEAGRSAGCKTMFIDYGYKEKQPVHFDFRVKSLAHAADIILARFTHDT
jgi:D-glycero-D-manno-heptose 1,7-bisphosphate phosphatase